MPHPRSLRLSAALALAMATRISPAQADWAFTHWGMTPDQVVSASGGTATILPSEKRTRMDPNHLEMTASGKYRDGTLTYDAGYMFDTEGHGLSCVFYNVTGDDVEVLKKKLTAQLGKPQSESSYGPMQDVKWTHGDSVELAIGQQPLAAAVTYCAPGK